ncbi:hypothetical protein EBZ39_00485 [bacterium]|nr:hypothetical protein [bacterium]
MGYLTDSPGIMLGANERTLDGINEELRGMPTVISFPDYAGYKIFATSSSRYVISVALLHDRVFNAVAG